MKIVTRKDLFEKAGFGNNEPKPSLEMQYLEIATLPTPTRLEIAASDVGGILNYSITEQKAVVSALVSYLPDIGCSVILVDEETKQRLARATRIANESEVDDAIHILLTP